VQFGYGLITCQQYPGDERPDRDRYAEALDLAAEAEALGFSSVWTSEHHFADDGYLPSLLPLSAAIAARTSRIDIGTGLLLAPLYDPLRIAEDAAVVDAISGGRFLLGLGQGWLGWEFEAFGKSLSERGRALERAVEVCRQAWGSGLVEPAGVAVTPKPDRPGGPPIWIGGGSNRALRRAARIADGWLAGEPGIEDFAAGVRLLRDELAAAGRDASTFTFGGYWPVFCWDGDDAWVVVRPYFHYMEWKYEDSETAKGRLGPPPLPPALDADGEASLREWIICGTPDEVAAHIGKLQEVAGEDLHFVGRHYFPGMDRPTMRRATELFAREVIPRFTGTNR
jgi:alkanesulfonate monooxygenase SsuD/methylene tetrahydromethanopterin reductase-like flavin-dependent oxidoreductase (luciferase family)